MTILAHAADFKPVAPRGQVGVVHRLQIGEFAPRCASIAQPVLKSQTLSSLEVQGAELNFHAGLFRPEFERGDGALSKYGYRELGAANPDRSQKGLLRFQAV